MNQRSAILPRHLRTWAQAPSLTGGESGPHYRPLNADHVRAVRDVCAQVGMAFLYKQKGGRTPKANGRLLDGVEWNQIPTARAA
jgi:protein gp37